MSPSGHTCPVAEDVVAYAERVTLQLKLYSIAGSTFVSREWSTHVCGQDDADDGAPHKPVLLIVEPLQAGRQPIRQDVMAHEPCFIMAGLHGMSFPAP